MTLGPVMLDLTGIALEPEERELLRHPRVGSVILFSRNYESTEQLRRLVQEIHALRTPALLVAVDHEGGRVQRFQDGFTQLPAMRTIGHQYDRSRNDGLVIARRLGWLMAAELRAVGVDLSLAPCVDLDYGVSRAIGDRALHPDSAVVSELAVAYMLGMRDAGMMATAKHFPGHGAVAADSHLAVPVDRRAWTDITAECSCRRANRAPMQMESRPGTIKAQRQPKVSAIAPARSAENATPRLPYTPFAPSVRPSWEGEALATSMAVPTGW